MKRFKSCLIALTLLACSAGCAKPPQFITGERIKYVKTGEPMPFDGYAVEKLKMLRLLKLAEQAVSDAEEPAPTPAP